MRINKILKKKPLATKVTVQGWLRSKRDSKELSFLDISDGSCLKGIQVIAPNDLDNYRQIKKLTTGASLSVQGLVTESPAKGQEIEIAAHNITILGEADPETYPLQKKRHSFEFLRSISHLRPRTNSLAAMARIRSRLAYGVHSFFQERGFYQVHTPIITTSDCEGAGEMFEIKAPARDDHFFGQQAFLSVSGQLEAEAYALALGRVYTFGPTFRAENSNTTRHLAEFWMVEPEIAFCDLAGDIELAQEMLLFLINDALNHCRDDLELFNRFIDKGLLERLTDIGQKPFSQISYDEAVKILKESGREFSLPVEWGLDLQSDHEKHLTELHQGPVVITDYPATIKPFYMRLNNDGKTVAAMDILLPGIGEIIGGSQREERLNILQQRMKEQGIDKDDYGWYLDLRRYGSVPHSGFGLGFERLLLYLTGMGNIRDTIPFPRTPA